MTKSPDGPGNQRREQDAERDRRSAAIKTTIIVVTAVVVLAGLAWVLTQRLIESSLR
jgi:hypothetical protein